MKKFLIFVKRIGSVLFVCLFSLALFSCSGLLQKESDNGYVSFDVPVDALFNQINSSRSIDSTRIAYCTYRMDISIIGNKYEVSKSTTLTADDKNLSVRFDKIPVGKKVYAVAKVYEVVEENGTKNENLLMYGKSETKKIKAGLTFLKLNIYNYLNEFQFTLTISFSDVSSDELEEVVNNLIISAVPANSNEGRAITDAGSDKYKLYEALSNPFSDSSQFYCNGHDEKLKISLDKASKKLTVSGTMAIPVNEDAPDSKGKEIMLVASMYKNQNNSLKPKLFGKSQNIIPEKGKQFDAAITVKKLNVLDTPMVTYSKITDTDYSINLDNKALEQHMSNNNYCFDDEGNIYFINHNENEYEIICSNHSDVLIFSQISPQGITYDNVTKKFYLYQINEATLSLWDVSNEINNWNTQDFNSNSKNINYVEQNTILSSFSHTHIAIHNNILYDIGQNSYGWGDIRLVILDLTTVPDNGLITPTNVIDLVSLTGFTVFESMEQKYLSVTDMVFVDNDLYLLLKQKLNVFHGAGSGIETFGFYFHGALIKYNITSGQIEKTMGWVDSPINLPAHYIYGGDYDSIIYKDRAKTLPCMIYADPVKTDPLSNNKKIADLFPKFYVPVNEDDTIHFFGPQKILAIKPKKLIIADEGYAFYADENDAIRYKNVNRVVTIDLEKFSATVSNTNEKFDSESNDDFKSSAFASSDSVLEPGATYYIQNNSAFEEDWVKAYIPHGED
ncbi:MAG: hypothetical protein IK024_05805 [Treponema sp.]|nr:hypothetical protein [Treponema sp.]